MSDTRTIVVSVVGTGIGVVTIVVGFIAIVASGIIGTLDEFGVPGRAGPKVWAQGLRNPAPRAAPTC